MGPSGLVANQRITAETRGLQIVLMPAYLPGLVRFLQDVTTLANPLLVEKFPSLPFEPGHMELMIALSEASIPRPFSMTSRKATPFTTPSTVSVFAKTCCTSVFRS